MHPSVPSTVEALVIGDGDLRRAIENLSRDVPLSAQVRFLHDDGPAEKPPHVYLVCVPAQDARPALDHIERLALRWPDIPVIAWMETSDESGALVALERGADEVLPAASSTTDGICAALRRAFVRAQRRSRGSTDAAAAGHRELRDFSRRVAHDLQASLLQMASSADLATRAVRKQETEPAILEITRLQSAMQTLLAHTRRLFDFSQATDPDGPLELLDLNLVTKNVMSDLAGRLQNGKAQVLVRELPTVRARPGSMYQLFLNLVDNALRFAVDGTPPRIEIGSARAPEGWRVWVSDRGPGIDPSVRDGLFCLSGTGLGLAICRRIVESHGGRLWADSEAGRGACFYFTLPVS